MKKLVLFIIFVLALLAIPFMLKDKIFKTMIKEIPGNFAVEKFNLNWFSEITLEKVTWEYENTKVEFPRIVISSSLLDLFFSKKTTYQFLNGKVYYKDKLLLDKVIVDPILLYKKKKLTLVQACIFTAAIVEEGVNAFTNHILIPPFSSPLVSLHLSSGDLFVESKSSLRFEGDLRLGVLKCGDNYLLTTILNLLRGKIPTTISVECGIMPFIFQNGVFSFERTHFLIDNTFEIVSLGTANLMSDALNIHVGLTTSSLIRAFDLTALPPGYMVPFTIKGTTHKPLICIKDAVKTIAALILLEKIDPKYRVYPKTQSF